MKYDSKFKKEIKKKMASLFVTNLKIKNYTLKENFLQNLNQNVELYRKKLFFSEHKEVDKNIILYSII